MHRREFLSLTPVPALLRPWPSPADQRAAARPATDARFEAIATLVSRKMREYRVPGVGLGVLVDGRSTVRGFGVTRLDDPQAVTPDTLFTIASISKTVTATAIMRLVEIGALDLHAPIRRYLPDFRVRDDDTTEAIAHRLDLYEEQTSPLIEYYQRDGRLAIIDGVASPDEVFRRLTAAVVAIGPISPSWRTVPPPSIRSTWRAAS